VPSDIRTHLTGLDFAHAISWPPVTDTVFDTNRRM
jgi:hypothetical protein